uniref:LysM domain-containing protein n=1 Tax=Desulfovibrio sp. U5L TaxID=596152 RepID=I2PZ58_9BACT
MKSGLSMLLALLLGLALGGCNKEDPQGFPKVDYNKDGRIIFEELIVVFPDLTVEEFLAADADHNGALDDKEYQRFHEARLAGRKLEPSAAPAPGAGPAVDGQPAAPAAATGAPAPAAPGTPEAPVPAAPPATSAAPAGGEVVETVEVGPGPAAPGPEAARTHTVARGDNLSRIAKKFGVTSKAIMAANGMKSADRLEAGTTLTIPASGESAATGTPASPAVAAFVDQLFAKNASGDLNGLLDSYGETVDYYKKGKSGKDIVRQDKADYFSRWPERSYTPGPATVEKLPGGDLRVTVPTAFTAKSGKKRVAGQAAFTFLLRPEGDSFRIVGEQSVVTEKK